MQGGQGRFMRKVKHYAYLEQDVLGQGASGKVYQGINEQTGQKVAIKYIDMITQYLLACEKEALQVINNRYVLHAADIIQNKNQCMIITDLCEGGTLKDYIRKNRKIPEKQTLEILHKLLIGYRAIKDKGFVHRDLKSSNIMFMRGEPIIIDFGYCQKLYGEKPKVFYNVGSPSYMSPEAYYKTSYSEKSDLWALGIILYEMLEGHTIDQGMAINRYFNNIIKNGYTLHTNISHQTQNILKNMLNIEAPRRPSTGQIINQIQLIINQNKMTNHQMLVPMLPLQNVFKPHQKQITCHPNFHNTQQFREIHQKKPTTFRQIKQSMNLKQIHEPHRQIKYQICHPRQSNNQSIRNSHIFDGIAKMSESIMRNERSLQKFPLRSSTNSNSFEIDQMSVLRNSNSTYLHPRDSLVQRNPKNDFHVSSFNSGYDNESVNCDSVIIDQNNQNQRLMQPRIIQKNGFYQHNGNTNEIPTNNNFRNMINHSSIRDNKVMVRSLHFGEKPTPLFLQNKKNNNHPSIAQSLIFQHNKDQNSAPLKIPNFSNPEKHQIQGTINFAKTQRVFYHPQMRVQNQNQNAFFNPNKPMRQFHPIPQSTENRRQQFVHQNQNKRRYFEAQPKRVWQDPMPSQNRRSPFQVFVKKTSPQMQQPIKKERISPAPVFKINSPQNQSNPQIWHRNPPTGQQNRVSFVSPQHYRPVSVQPVLGNQNPINPCFI